MVGIRLRPTYAGMTATLALFIALGGGAYAAATLPANSVGTKQIKKSAVERAKIKNGAGEFEMWAGLTEELAALLDAARVLSARWEATREAWTDSVSRGFEDDYIGPLQLSTRASAEAIVRLNERLVKAAQSVT